MPLGAPMIAAIIAGGASSAIGGALKNKSTSTSTPTFLPEFGGLKDQLLNLVRGRLSSSTDLSGYTAGGIGTINRGYDLAQQGTENSLTSRGLARSPIAANADLTRNLARAGDVTRFQNSIPLLQRSLQTEDAGLAGTLLNMGRGQTNTLESGGGAAGAFTNLASYIGYLQGKGVFNKDGNGNQQQSQASQPNNQAFQPLIGGVQMGMPYALPGALPNVPALGGY